MAGLAVPAISLLKPRGSCSPGTGFTSFQHHSQLQGHSDIYLIEAQPSSHEPLPHGTVAYVFLP